MMDLPAEREPRSNYPRRPTRLDRVFADIPPVYFITFNTHHRVKILASNELRAAFVDFCSRAQDFHIAVGRYVLMPDHAHLFVAVPEMGSISLSKWIQSLKVVLGKRLIQLSVNKPHWQEGFFDHLLRNEESLAQKWEYVRMNPARAGLCDEPEAWPYQGEIVLL